MILAEIADKLPPPSIHIGAALVVGVGAATALTILQGHLRFIGVAAITLVAAALAWSLRIDADLVEAAQAEIGQGRMALSRFWIIGSVVIAIPLTLVFRSVSRPD